MTRYFFLLTILWIFNLPSAISQNLYTVQVGTFVDVRPQDFDGIRQLGFLYDQQVDPNLHRVFMGRYRSEAKAQPIVKALQQAGFTSARVQLVDKSNSDQQTVIIQIATRYSNKVISWTELQRVGPLNVILDDELIKVTTGTFPDIATAKNALPGIQAKGFSDAFIKTVPIVDLIPVTSLSTGIKEALIPLNIRESQSKGNVSTTLPPAAQPAGEPTVLTPSPSAPVVPRSTPQQEAVPQSYSRIPDNAGNNRIAATTPRSGTTKLAVPAIRADVKRRSVIELQKLLKAKGYYASTLDGYYGPGTQGAYENLLAQDDAYKRYSNLAAIISPVPTTPRIMDWDALQHLYAIAMHIGSTEAFAAQTALQQSANQRQQLLARTSGPDLVQTTTLDAWQQTLWTSLNSWSNKDIYLQETVNSLKLAYYQSQVLLEDYFMQRGLSTNDATGLAQAILQTIIEVPLDRFY